MGRRARFEIAHDIPGDPLVLRDLGPWDQHLTITNDVEAVVEEVIRRGLLPSGRRLFYIDSMESIDEIVVRDGKFVEFKVGAVREDADP